MCVTERGGGKRDRQRQTDALRWRGLSPCAQEKQPVEKEKLKTDLRGDYEWSKVPGDGGSNVLALKRKTTPLLTWKRKRG